MEVAAVNYIYLAMLIACLICAQSSIEAKRFKLHHLSPFGDDYFQEEDSDEEQQYQVCLSTCRNGSEPSLTLSCGMGASPKRRRRGLRVVGGRDAKPGEFPYSVPIAIDHGERGLSFCGGIIIDEQYILSAAHCFHDCKTNQKVQTKHVHIRIGEHKLDTIEAGEKSITISKLHIHPAFEACTRKGPDETEFQNDLALLKVSEHMKLRLPVNGYGSVNSICMPRSYKDYKAGQVAITTGWGLMSPPQTKFLRSGLAPILQVAKLEFDDMEHCQQVWRNHSYEVDERLQVCAYKPGGKEHSCYGDSGGALAIIDEDGSFELAGIVSFGDSRCENTKPAVYTRVSAFLDWIEPLRLGRRLSHLDWRSKY